MLCLCHYGSVLLRFWFHTELGRENSASYLKIQVGKTFSYPGHALVTLYVQFLCSDWSKFDRRVHAKNLCSIFKLVYFDSWSWQCFVSTCGVFNCSFPLEVQNEIQLPSRAFCYPWLVCSLGFWLRKVSLVKVGNPISDGIVFVFHLTWCVLKEGLKVSSDSGLTWYLSAAASRMLSLSNYCIWCFFYYIFHLPYFMKSSTVYVASLYRFVRFEAMIWQSIRFDIHSLNTRSASKIHIDFERTNYGKFSLHYRGPIIWNSLPNDLKELKSSNAFKKALHTHVQSAKK